jgi:large subunit ribosomal protein L18
MANEKIVKSTRRRKRVRSKIKGDLKRPRLTVFRSSKHIYAQIIDDVNGNTLVSASDIEFAKDLKKRAKSTKEDVALQTKKDIAFILGDLIAKKALKKKIKRVVFDRGGYKYHGRVAAVAEGARKGGLKL